MRAKYACQPDQLCFIRVASREAEKFLEKARPAFRRPELTMFDAEMFEYLVDSRVADVIDQLQRAKP